MAAGRWKGMTGRMVGFLQGLGLGALLAAARFPVAAVLIVCFSVLSNIEASRFDIPFWPDMPRLLSALAAAAAASVAVRVGIEPRWAGHAGHLQLLPALAALVLGLAIWTGQPLLLYAPALTAAAVLSIPLAPFLARGSPDDFWWFSLWTIVGVVLAFLSILLFVLGLFAILEMVRFLFRVGLGGSAYEHIVVTALTLVGPLFALGRIPETTGEGAANRRDERLVGVVRPLFDWVAAPLTLVMALVLHLYALRILVTGDVPRGEIGWIVGFFLALVLSLRVAIHPFLENAFAPARLLGRFWSAMLLVPLALLAYAVGLRVSMQGFTAPRYILALAVLVGVLCIVLQLWRRSRGDVRWIAGVGPLLLVLSLIGPWSIGNTVGTSQARLIEARFVEGGILRTTGLSATEASELRSRIVALGDVGELGRLLPVLPDRFEEARSIAASSREDDTQGFLRALGLRAQWESAPATRSFRTEPGQPMRIEGYDIAVHGRQVGPQWPLDAAAGADALDLRFDGAVLEVRFAGEIERFDLAESLASLPSAVFAGRSAVPPPVFELSSQAGSTVRLRVEFLTVDEDERPVNAVVTLLLRERDWTSLGGG